MLNENIYIVLYPDGSISRVLRNGKYFNHYQYLEELSNKTVDLEKASFGLTFSINNEIAKLFFFKELVIKGAIIIENHQILLEETVSSMSFYLPDEVTTSQKQFLNSNMKEIDDCSFVFLEEYDEEKEKFLAYYKKPFDIMSGGNLLKEYIEKHLVYTKVYKHL